MNKSAQTGPPSFYIWPSPAGWIGVVQGDLGVREIILRPNRSQVEELVRRSHPDARLDAEGTAEVRRQIDRYWSEWGRPFDLPLDFSGLSPFTVRVLTALAEIPCGTTVTYGELACRVGRPGAARAVGRAMATNPFPLVLPCHRVVGAGGRLTGYSGGEGIATKKWLLAFERGESDRRGLPQEKENLPAP